MTWPRGRPDGNEVPSERPRPRRVATARAVCRTGSAPVPLAPVILRGSRFLSGYVAAAEAPVYGPLAVAIATKLRAVLPGLGVAILLAVVARFVHRLTGNAVSPTLVAIAVGVLWRNTIGVRDWAEPGLEVAARRLLRLGIALIGLRLTLLVLADVSLVAIPIVLTTVAVAIAAAIGIGRALGVDVTMRRLIAAGTAICGATAIIAVAPLLRARKADVGIALTCIVLFGSMAMMGYPWVAGAIFGPNARAAGMFFGASIHDTSQVVGAALIYAEYFKVPDAVAIAGLTKFLRTLGLLVLVPLAAWLGSRESAPPAGSTKSLGRTVMPAFVIGFIALVAFRTLGDAVAGGSPELQAQWTRGLAAGQVASEWLLLCGMAAVGLGVTFAHLREAGWRPVVVAFAAALLAGASTLVWCVMAVAR